MEKNNGRNIDRREGVPTVNRKLACPAPNSIASPAAAGSMADGRTTGRARKDVGDVALLLEGGGDPFRCRSATGP